MTSEERREAFALTGLSGIGNLDPDTWTEDDIRAAPTADLLMLHTDPERALVYDIIEEQRDAAMLTSLAESARLQQKAIDRAVRVLPWVNAEINRRIPVAHRPAPATDLNEVYSIYNAPRVYAWRWQDPNATATEVRDSITGCVGMMADARTEEMNTAYINALVREGKVDTCDGPRPPKTVPDLMWLAGKIIDKYGTQAPKPSVQLALGVEWLELRYRSLDGAFRSFLQDMRAYVAAQPSKDNIERNLIERMSSLERLIDEMAWPRNTRPERR